MISVSKKFKRGGLDAHDSFARRGDGIGNIGKLRSSGVPWRVQSRAFMAVQIVGVRI